MRFEEMVHWNDGQFLQPHHFQYLQRFNFGYIRQSRNFSLPYPYGLVDFELEREALTGARINIRHFSAIMSDGLEISMPGNCILKPLDLTPALKQYPNELTIYIAVPLWSEYEGNLADEANPLEKKLYLTEKKRSRDENSGDNEISLITRRINARLITNLDDAKDMQVLPILHLNIMTHDKAESVVAIDEKYAPPFMLLTADSPVFDMAQGLIVDIQRCRNKILNTLTLAKFRPEIFSGENGHSLLNLRVLNLYETRLSSLLVSGHITPFDLYLELSSLLAELMGLNPMNGVREIKKYVHEDSLPVFSVLISDIRSFIQSEGGASYTRIDFKQDEDNYLCVALQTEDIITASELYLAVHTGADDAVVVRELELGDTFKVTSPQSKELRSRGVKLSETRYPPRFLPVLNKTLWFKLELEESARVWREICEAKAMVIDRAHNLFPELETSLFITVGTK